MKKHVVSLSGGLDSSTLLGWVLNSSGVSPKDVLAISFGYGQSHIREIFAAQEISAYYGVELQQINLPDSIFEGSESTLITHEEQPHKTYQELMSEKGPSPTYIPFRNGIFIAILGAIAIKTGAGIVWVGTHAEDAHNWAYPDCSSEFNRAMGQALNLGTYYKVNLATPFENMWKKEILAWGLENGVPYEKTWSCYEGKVLACGKCPTCVERLEAFKSLGRVDPILYLDDWRDIKNDN